MHEKNHESKPEFLQFSCATDQGSAERCTQCPVNERGYCEAFSGYVQKQLEKFSSDQNSDLQQSNIGGRKVNISEIRKADEDCLTPLKVAFIEVEKKLPNYEEIQSFQGWINSIYKKRLLDQRRTYDKQSIALSRLFEVLEWCEVLAGQEELDRIIRYTFIPKPGNYVSNEAPSLCIVDTRLKEWLLSLANQENMAILAHGGLRPEQEVIEAMKNNNGVLFWLSQDMEKDLVLSKVNKIARVYLDVNLWTLSGSNENSTDDGSGPEPEIPDFSWMEHMNSGEISRDIECCFERMFGIAALKNCATLIYHFHTISCAFHKDPNSNEAYFDNGEIRKGKIYEKIGEILGKQPNTVKKAYSRCLEEGTVYDYLRDCLAAYKNDST